jgi:hypothetical protein
VVPGENGFIVDVSSANDLASVLQQIDSEPSRYIAPTPLASSLRTSVSQVSEYVELYRNVIESDRSKKDATDDLQDDHPTALAARTVMVGQNRTGR